MYDVICNLFKYFESIFNKGEVIGYDDYMQFCKFQVKEFFFKFITFVLSLNCVFVEKHNFLINMM